MPEINLTQVEANALIAMEKHRIDDRPVDYPLAGDALRVALTSADGREAFWLDISRGRIDLAKGTYQNRARQVVVLVRLDFGGPTHRNPDGEEVTCPHLHVYREGFGDKWAIPLPEGAFSGGSEVFVLLEEFMRYCNITKPPLIQRGLFT